ncbi:hypothetical protein [Thiohalophilus sp.]|uniref:hypothetical protein n=1 Tax=Thiohalophilus sp. TaxID=3028392 RepID=UPI002ACEACBD|nr:hypothetical protein [Thiohalophilus sp.]MDZ7661957.1 hypothetical protein [Thiohalophilus sp.]
MTAAVALSPVQNFYIPSRNTGSSACSNELDDALMKTLKYMREPISRQSVETLVDEIIEVAGECYEDNWDGYDAQRISSLTTNEAISFAVSLPAEFPIPEVIPVATGEIAFEWDYGKNRIFVVTVKGNNSIAYAGLLGAGSRVKGIESYSEHVPKVVVDSVRRISK